MAHQPNAAQLEARRRWSAIHSRAELLAQRLVRNQATASGVEISFGSLEYELNEKLRGEQRWATLERMTNDPRVKGTLRINTLPLLRATWKWEPATDDNEGQRAAALLNANLLRKPDLEAGFGADFFIRTPWIQRLSEILRFLQDGRAIFVGTLRSAPGLRQVFDRLQWLEPSTISGTKPWVLDKADNILAVRRDFTRPDTDEPVTDEEIPGSRLYLYGWEIVGARYDGKPLIRPLYGAWFRKDFVQRMGAIWAQKVGAPPPWGVYPSGWTDETTRGNFERFVQSLRGSAPTHTWGTFPMGKEGEKPEIHYAGAQEGEVDRMGALVDVENREIAAGAGGKTLLLGETQSGSRALGGTIGLLEMVMAETIVAFVVEFETHGAANLEGPASRLIRNNFGPAMPTPKLTASQVNPFELIELTDEIVQAKAVGLIPDHPLIRRQYTERVGFRGLPDEAFEQAPAPPIPPGDGLAARLRLQGAISDPAARIRRLLQPAKEDRPRRGRGFRS